MLKKILTILTLIMVLFACNESPKLEEVVESKFGIPFKGADIEYKTTKVMAESGDTINYRSGTVVRIPPNSFMDSAGNLTTGEVELKFREFNDPLDFFMAGLDMEYDSAGFNYNFISAGMCDIYAFQNGKLLVPNPDKNIGIDLASSNDDPNFNLYYYDSSKSKWDYLGASLLKNRDSLPQEELNLKEADQYSFAEPLENTEPEPEFKEGVLEIQLPDPPIEPQKASNTRPTFAVNAPYADFVPELKVFQNTKFEIDESDRNFKPKHAEIEWDYVELKRTKTEGIYIVEFSTKKKKVAYRVRPVYEGVDYEEAMKVFEQNRLNYEAERLALLEEKKLEEKRRRQEYQRELELWKKEEAVRKENAKLLAQESRKRDQEKRREAYQVRRESSIIQRSFNIVGFGRYNCDVIMGREDLFTIQPKYLNTRGEEIKLVQVCLVLEGTNALIRQSIYGFSVFPNSRYMIYGVSKAGKLTYFTFEQSESFPLEPSKLAYEFEMTTHPDKIETVSQVTKILNL